LFSYTFLNILQFGVNLSAPNLKWYVQWMQAHVLTPLGILGADSYRRYQGFNIGFENFLSGGAPYNFFQIIQNKV
jgi:hypothetical protein